MNILEDDLSIDWRHDDAAGVVLRRLLRVVNYITETLQRKGGFLHGLPDGGHPQQWTGDITGDDPEGDQFTEAEFPIQHQGCAAPDHQQTRQLIKEGTKGVSSGAEQGVVETLGHKIRIEILPLPATAQFDVLGLNSHHAAQNLYKMALGAGVGYGTALQLIAHQGRHREGERNQHWNDSQGQQGELPAVDHHHNYI